LHGSFLLRRLLIALPTLLGVAIIVFVLMRVVPGNPIAMMTPPGATEADIERLRALYGLDKPVPEQFAIWLGQVAEGDFGTSISQRRSVLALIAERLPATLELALAAMTVAVLLGVVLAVAGTWWGGRWPEAVIDGITGLVLAIPDFLWALIFILVFGVLVAVLPISGRIDPRLAFDFVTQFYLAESLLRGAFGVFATLLAHLVLPAAALALPLTAVITRVLKSSLAEAMTQDYVRMAAVRGFSRLRIIVGEALGNALIPTVTLTGVQFTFLIGGTVLVERIFAYPGIGNMAIGAVIDRDLPLIQGLVLTFALLFIAINLAVDMSYALLNPRLRHG
jgi:ABC-type dipeptide/oligopeptide/nickel transport system permease component